MRFLKSLAFLLPAHLLLTEVSLAGDAATSQSQSPNDVWSEVVSVRTLDDREINLLIDRPADDTRRVPLLVVVDGSGCGGSMRPGFDTLFKPHAIEPSFARLRVEKYGVEFSDDRQDCSEEFLKHYTMDGRVSDHLRAFQYLRTHAPWWNGELFLFGWSDGGDIAGQIVSQYPLVTRAVLGAMGGGYTMAEHFRDFWICSSEMAAEERRECQLSVEKEFEQIFDNPTWKKTQYGGDNSWKAWNSRLWTRLSNTLVDNRIPILIVHGSNDFDGTPVDSARKLVSDLEAAGNTSFTYWEVPDMGHGWSSNPSDGFDRKDSIAIERAMMDWLLKGGASIEDLCQIGLESKC